MSNLQINTTQNVYLDYKIVSIGERIIAFLIERIYTLSLPDSGAIYRGGDRVHL